MRTRAEQIQRLWDFYYEDLKNLSQNGRDYAPINQQENYSKKVDNLLIALQEVIKELTLMESYEQMLKDKNTIQTNSVSTDYLDSSLKSFPNKADRDMIESSQRELYKP